MSLFFLETGDGGGTNTTQRVTLGEKSYSINHRYNLRDESWTISLGLVGADPMFTVKACCNRILNSHYKHLKDSPQGDLVIVDVTGKYGRTDFDGYSSTGRYRLLYNDLVVA